MNTYYLDIETTGLFPSLDKIITIQYQKIDSLGNPLEPLTILKEWDNSERAILSGFYPIMTEPKTIFVGKNLSFEYAFFGEKYRKYEMLDLTFEDFNKQMMIDVYSVCVLINKGVFLGWSKIIQNTNSIMNHEILILYKNKQYDKILSYIKTETSDFLNFYRNIALLLPKLKKVLS